MAMALQHCQAGRFQVAEQIFRLVLQAEPNHVAAHNNLGNALQEQGRLEEAVLFYQCAVQLDPGFAMPYSNLGGVLYAQGKLNEAVRRYQRALELTPELADAHNNLGVAFQDQGRLDEAVACYRSALELRPDSCTSHSDYLYCQQYLPGATLAQLASIHQQWDQRHAAPFRAAWRRHENSADPQRRLRLGFVSVGFRRHPAGYLFVRALESLDAKDCETICYANHGGPDDAITARLKKAAGTWRTALGLSDEALAGQIRSDGVDILFDLDGHHGGNRLLVFARRPAPIQITWLAYVGTTGLAAMDYILADHYHIPEQSERYYREKVLRMPSGYICYDPPPDAPPVASLPALGRGYVTFGSFNRPPKITPAVVATWADILRRVPGARLILLHTAFGDSGTTRHYERLFSAQGVPPNRFDLLGPKPYQESWTITATSISPWTRSLTRAAW